MGAIDGLISGLNTTQIISQLMQVERLPEQQLTDHKTASQTMVSSMQGLNSLFTALQTAANAFVPDSITQQSAWGSTTGTSSASTLASVTTGPTAQPGSARFTVTSVASATSVVSSGTVGSLTSTVATSPFTVTKGAAGIGLSSVTPGATLSAGAHTITVTPGLQRRDPHGPAGPAAHGGPRFAEHARLHPQGRHGVVHDLGDVRLGRPHARRGRCRRSASASGGALTARIDDSGHLQVSTAREGSAVSLTVDSGNTALGLAASSTPAVGQDGLVTLDGVAQPAVTSAGPGGTLTLTGANGDTVQATLTGGLRLGAADHEPPSSAGSTATLSDVARAISASGVGVNATAVGVSSSAYRLQLTSTTTGSASDITISGGGLDTTLGGMQVLNAGSDAVLHVGTGPGAFDVTSPTNSITGLLPGVTITALRADPSTQVSVDVSSDSSGIADKMASLVAAANSALAYIDQQSAYDADLQDRRPAARRLDGPRPAPAGDGRGHRLLHQHPRAQWGLGRTGRDGQLRPGRVPRGVRQGPAAVSQTMTSMSQQLANVAKQASDPAVGSITTRIQGEQDSIRDYTQQIADFEDRMTLRQQTLQTQYAALETALGSLQSQSQWLTGQLASLPTISSK